MEKPQLKKIETVTVRDYFALQAAIEGKVEVELQLAILSWYTGQPVPEVERMNFILAKALLEYALELVPALTNQVHKAPEIVQIDGLNYYVEHVKTMVFAVYAELELAQQAPTTELRLMRTLALLLKPADETEFNGETRLALVDKLYDLPAIIALGVWADFTQPLSGAIAAFHASTHPRAKDKVANSPTSWLTRAKNKMLNKGSSVT